MQARKTKIKSSAEKYALITCVNKKKRMKRKRITHKASKTHNERQNKRIQL